MRNARRLLAAALVAAPLFVAACRHDRDPEIKVSGNDAKFVARDSTRKLGPGDIRVASRDSELEVALIGDSLVLGFGAKTRDKVKEATDTAAVKGTGFAASIEKMVKKNVAGMLDHELEFPLSGVSDVQYEGGMLRFYDANGKPMHIMENKRREASNDAMFRPEDAQAFIAAFKAKKTAL